MTRLQLPFSDDGGPGDGPKKERPQPNAETRLGFSAGAVADGDSPPRSRKATEMDVVSQGARPSPQQSQPTQLLHGIESDPLDQAATRVLQRVNAEPPAPGAVALGRVRVLDAESAGARRPSSSEPPAPRAPATGPLHSAPAQPALAPTPAVESPGPEPTRAGLHRVIRVPGVPAADAPAARPRFDETVRGAAARAQPSLQRTLESDAVRQLPEALPEPPRLGQSARAMDLATPPSSPADSSPEVPAVAPGPEAEPAAAGDSLLAGASAPAPEDGTSEPVQADDPVELPGMAGASRRRRWLWLGAAATSFLVAAAAWVVPGQGVPRDAPAKVAAGAVREPAADEQAPAEPLAAKRPEGADTAAAGAAPAAGEPEAAASPAKPAAETPRGDQAVEREGAREQPRPSSEKPEAPGAAELSAANEHAAADLFIAGRYRDALDEYRLLAKEHPDRTEFADFVRILRRRLVDRCIQNNPHRREECEAL